MLTPGDECNESYWVVSLRVTTVFLSVCVRLQLNAHSVSLFCFSPSPTSAWFPSPSIVPCTMHPQCPALEPSTVHWIGATISALHWCYHQCTGVTNSAQFWFLPCTGSSPVPCTSAFPVPCTVAWPLSDVFPSRSLDRWCLHKLIHLPLPCVITFVVYFIYMLLFIIICVVVECRSHRLPPAVWHKCHIGVIRYDWPHKLRCIRMYM